MSLRAFRRFWSVVVLVAMAGSLGVPLFGDLHADLEASCPESAWPGTQHQTTQVEIVRQAHGDSHCAICHLQRFLTGAADDAKRFVESVDQVSAHAVVVEAFIVRETTRNLPSRAPPSLFA